MYEQNTFKIIMSNKPEIINAFNNTKWTTENEYKYFV